MRAPLIVATLLTALVAAVFAQPRSGSTTAYRLITHPANPATSVGRKFLGDAFLKKVTRWPDDQAIRPVDLDPDSPVRKRFSEEVLGRSVAAVKSYWQQIIFSGRDIPPPELDSDEDIIQYVLKHPGAVGYVSAGANIGAA